MAIIGEREPMGTREAQVIGALSQMFADDWHESVTMTTRGPDITTGRCLSDPFTSQLSIGEAYAMLKQVDDDQAYILRRLYGDHLTRRALAEREHMDRDRISTQENRGLVQLIRWLFDDPEYQSVLRTHFRTRRKDTQEWQDWVKFRESPAYEKVYMRMRKRRMGV